MPKIKQTANRVIVHTGNWWQRYHRASQKTKSLWQFRIKDVGRLKHSELILCKPPHSASWHTYGWSFSNQQVKKKKKNNHKLIVYDRKAFEILAKMKEKGELKGYAVVLK